MTQVVEAPSVLVGSSAPGVVYTKPWMVELVLDLAGYTVDKPLGRMVALEPSAGDGAFLCGMVRRLVESCRLHRIPLAQAAQAIGAFEISPTAADRAVCVVRDALGELGVPAGLAETLSRSWIRADDFLLASLAFPIADVVVGNPPYIRLEEIPSAKAACYRASFSAMRGRADLYVAFYQAALLQLRPDGVCAFICADRWMLNDYGSSLREFITTEGYAVRFVVEAHDVEAFDSEVSAYPAITVIAKAAQGPVVVAKAMPGIETTRRERLVAALTAAQSLPVLRSFRLPEWFHGGEPWPCSSPDGLALLKRLETSCLPLESEVTGTRIGIGVATGADRVFIVDSPPDVESDRLLPLAMASDLRNGRVGWSGTYLVNPWDESGLVDLRAYPRLEAYLRNEFTTLSARHTAKDRPAQWHKTIDRVNLGLVRMEKLLIADIKDRLLPALDSGTTYPHHNLYWITSRDWDLRLLGGLLMSAVGEFFIRCYAVRMRGGFMRFQAQYLRRIRVPHPETIAPGVRDRLRRAFELQDFNLATEAALEAYGIDSLPG